MAVLALAVVSHRLLRAPPFLPEKKQLAVLPFSALGDDSELQESAVGLTRVVASGLSLIEQGGSGVFWVVPLEEAERRGAESAQKAHRIFGATVAISGHLQRVGDRLRLDLEAVDAATGQVLRRHSIEDNVSNLSSFQEEPVLRICEMLGLPVSPAARDRLASMATTMPEGYEAYLRGVGAYVAADDEDSIDSAIGLLETATSLDPLFATGRVALGRAYLRKSDFSESSEWIDRAAEEAARAIRDGEWPEDGYDLLADIHRVQGQLPEAVEALEGATRVAPESAEAHLKLAMGYQEMGRDEDSERHFQRAIFLRPGFWEANHRLARLYISQGKYDAAATQYREVISFAPELTRGYNNLGAMLSYLGHTGEARDVFERSIAIEPSRSALSNLGTLYFDDKRYADAAAMFERALEEDDGVYYTWGNLAYAYKFGPAPEKAEGCFRKAIELAETIRESEPRDWWALTDLAGYYAMLDDRETGFALIEQVVAEPQQEPQLIAHIAETFEDLGDRDQALEWVARAFDAGLSSERFDERPTLRELVADERYQLLVQERNDR
jgi:serine/threonine-protein kinase